MRKATAIKHLREDYMDAAIQWWSDAEVAAYESGVVTRQQVKRVLSGVQALTRATETIRRRVYSTRKDYGRDPWRLRQGPSPYRHYRPQVEAYQEDGKPKGPFVEGWEGVTEEEEEARR